MTISSTTRIAGPFTGNGVTTTFPFTYKVFSTADVQVIQLTISTGLETTLTIVTDYTITLNGDQDSNPGGNIVLVTPLLALYKLTATSDIANLQPTDLTNQGGFYPEVITDALDRATIQIQQLADQTDRAIKIPISDGVLDMTTPGTADRSSKYFVYDASGLPSVSSGSGTDTALRTDLANASASLAGSRLSGFRQTGTGATERTVDAKLKDTVSVKDFGAVGDGVADDTAAIQAALNYAIPLNLPVILSGTYKVTSALQTTTTRASGDLHLICNGDVSINVDAASTAFVYLIFLQTTASNNVSITGGSLNINCNNKAAYGFYLKHLATSNSGTVNIDCPVTIKNCYQSNNNQNAAGISINGNFPGGAAGTGGYLNVTINDATIIGVSRLNVGVCRGIEVAYCGGQLIIRRPYIENVLCTVGDQKDADGIAVFGAIQPIINTTQDTRIGYCTIEDGVFIDCQGRSVKSQFTNTTISNPSVFRKSIVTISSGHDFDFQMGGGKLLNAKFEYRLNGATSPLGASFAPVSFQNRMQDKQLQSSCVNSLIVSDVSFTTFAVLIYSTTALSSSVKIDGLVIIPSASIATAVITNAIANISTAENIATMPGTATIVVCNVRGPCDAHGVGYSGYTGGTIAAKLVVEVTNYHNTLAAGSFSHAFASLSGTQITSLNSLTVYQNHNIRNVVFSYTGPTTAFDFQNLTVGSIFGVDIASVVSVSNAPPWETGSGAWAVVEVLASVNGGFGTKIIRVTAFAGTGNLRSKTFISEDNAGTWFEIKNCAPVTKTTDFTLASLEDVVINNKAGSTCTVTLSSASAHTGRSVLIKTIQAQTVVSASSNVVPLVGGAAGTAILAAIAGRWAQLVSDGTNWIIMSSN